MTSGSTRISVTVPADGVFTLVRSGGKKIVVESTPDGTVAGVPVIRPEQQDGPELPAYKGASYEVSFDQFFIEGTTASEGGTLSLLLLTGTGIDIEFPATSE